MSESTEIDELALEWSETSIEVLDAEFQAYRILSNVSFKIPSNEEMESY